MPALGDQILHRGIRVTLRSKWIFRSFDELVPGLPDVAAGTHEQLVAVGRAGR